MKDPTEEQWLIDACDPGIRQVVKMLREAGFETTDSGDGVSKPQDWYESGEALPYPHVACSVPQASFWSQARSLQKILDENYPGEWRVEASYCPKDESTVLLAVHE